MSNFHVKYMLTELALKGLKSLVSIRSEAKPFIEKLFCKMSRGESTQVSSQFFDIKLRPAGSHVFY